MPATPGRNDRRRAGIPEERLWQVGFVVGSVLGAAITVAGVQYAAKVPYGVLRTAGHHLLHIEEKPTTHQLVNAGMYVLSPEVLRYVPGDKPYKMTELIDDVLHDGLNVSVFPVLERWSDIGSKEEFERVLFEFAVEEES